MSSHHIIRDRQEPSLVIWDWASYEILEELLQWSPLVIVHENMLETILNWGFKVDYILSETEDFDTIHTQINYQFLYKIILIKDLQSIFSKLKDEKIEAINLLTNQALQLIETIDSIDYKVVIYDTEKVYFKINTGFSQWFYQQTIHLHTEPSQDIYIEKGFFEYDQTEKIWISYQY